MSIQVYSVQAQTEGTEGRRKVFWNEQTVLSTKLSLTSRGDANYYKSVHHPIPALPVGLGNTLTIF